MGVAGNGRMGIVYQRAAPEPVQREENYFIII
jgi:hypothetical protein